MKHFVFIFIFLIGFSLKAQSPYSFNWKKDVPITTIGLGSIATAYILESKRTALTWDEVNSLDRTQISVFDRSATYNWNPKAAKWSDALMYTSFSLPLLFLAEKNSREDFWRASTISAQVFVVNTGLTFLTKELVQRKRPYVYNPDAPDYKKVEKDASQSFFSGHTSSVASMSFSFALMHQHYFPESRFKPLVWFAAAVLPMATAILRVRAGKHFWTDVLVGYGVGAMVGVGIPMIHFNRKK